MEVFGNIEVDGYVGSAQTPVAGIIAQEVSVIDDNNNVTSGNSQTTQLNNLFINPPEGVLSFTSVINSELGDVETIQSTEFIACTDCNGDFGGGAFIDSCGNCVGGTTSDENYNCGSTPCQENWAQDCNGICNGLAYLD